MPKSRFGPDFVAKPDYTARSHWGGTHDRAGTYEGAITVRAVRLDSGGYAPDGRYFGVGARLWEAEDEETGGDHVSFYLRAGDKDIAKSRVRRMYPHNKIK